jgi:hypothetical protein
MSDARITNSQLSNEIEAEFRVQTILHSIVTSKINPVVQILNNKNIDKVFRDNLELKFEKLIREEIQLRDYINASENNQEDIISAMNLLNITNSDEINWNTVNHVIVDNIGDAIALASELKYRRYNIDLAMNTITPYIIDINDEDEITVQLYDSNGQLVTVIANYIYDNNIFLNFYDVNGNRILVNGQLYMTKEFLDEQYVPDPNQRFKLTTGELQSVHYEGNPLFILDAKYPEFKSTECYIPTYLNLSEYIPIILNMAKLLQTNMLTTALEYKRISCAVFEKPTLDTSNWSFNNIPTDALTE